MIKHDHMEKSSAELNKQTTGGSADSVLRHDAKRTEYEKNMRKPDGDKGSDVPSRGTIQFETTTEMFAFQQKGRPSASDNTNMYHTKSTPKTDVEKNIDEAERYINFIATQKSIKAVSGSEQKSQKPLPSTTELHAFEPKMSFESGEQSSTSVYIPRNGASGSAMTESEQTRAYRIGANEDEPTRAFRVGNVEEPTRAFPIGGGIGGQTTVFQMGGSTTGQTRAYPAVGSITEQTRAYRAGGAITEQTKAYGINPMIESRTQTIDGFSEQGSELQKTAEVENDDKKKRNADSAKKKRQPKEQPVHYEYTSHMQNKKIVSEIKGHYKSAKLRLGFAIFFAIALFLMENIAPIRNLFPTRFSYIMTDWICAFICAALVSVRMIEAFKSFFRWKPAVDSITLIAFVFSVAATTAALIFEKTDSAVMLYNFPFAVCVVLDLLFLSYRYRRDLYSFSVLSSSHDKCAMVLGDSEKESLSEAEYFLNSGKTEDIKFGAVKNVEFIDGYFAHASETPSLHSPLKFFLPLCLLISVVFCACSLWIMRYSVAESLGIAYAAFMMCAPLSAFLAYCYPLYLSARRAHSYHSAILCDKTPDTYRDASMVVFRDTEAIPSGKAKVKGIRLYGDKKIDNAIYYASSIYSAIGGPLEEVFRNAALNSVSSENVQIREICNEGVCAMVDNKNIVIGRPAYMEEQCFETMYEPGDDEYEGKTNKRIFYLACDQFIIAKFYIQYSVSADFLYMANRLLSAGLSISVRTADPCLDDGIFYENKIDPEQNAIRISRACLQDKDEESVPANRAGIVSVGDVKDLVKSFLLCKKLESVRRTNLVLNVVASVFAVAVMSLVIFTGNAPEMNSVYPALYHLFWILPTYFVSKVYL